MSRSYPSHQLSLDDAILEAVGAVPDHINPDGVTRFYTTRQMPPNTQGFVGYETVWKPLQKEVPYKTPKTP